MLTVKECFSKILKNDTLCALLASKMNQDSACYEFVPSSSLLKAAKSATNDYNNALTVNLYLYVVNNAI
jgi:hypothetical protein